MIPSFHVEHSKGVKVCFEFFVDLYDLGYIPGGRKTVACVFFCLLAVFTISISRRRHLQCMYFPGIPKMMERSRELRGLVKGVILNTLHYVEVLFGQVN